MYIRKRKTCLWFALICLVIIAFAFDKNVVKANQTVGSQTQTTSSNTSSSIPNQNAIKISEYFKYVLTVILAGLLTIINIYRYFLERKYEIILISVYLINEDITYDDGYTRFNCEKIIRNGQEIEKKRLEMPYYLDVSIKISSPNTRKNIENIVIKEIEFDIDGYILQYKCEGNTYFGYKKCRVEKQEGICSLLFKYPSIKKYNGVSKINPTLFFKNPEVMHMSFKWATSVSIFSIFGFLFPKSVKVEFEKKEYQNTRMGIESKKIY